MPLAVVAVVAGCCCCCCCCGGRGEFLLLPHMSQMSSRALFRYVQAWHSHRDDDDRGAAAAAGGVVLGGERCLL